MSIAETITINIDDYNKMKAENKKYEQLRTSWMGLKKYISLQTIEIEKLENKLNSYTDAYSRLMDSHKEYIKELKKEICEISQSLEQAEDGYGSLEEENEQLKQENEKLKEKIEKRRLVNCRKSEELVKALSPWKKDHQDHKRILEVIGELKQENEKLKKEKYIN